MWRRHGRQDLLGWSRDAKQEGKLRQEKGSSNRDPEQEKEKKKRETRLRAIATEADIESCIVMDTASQGDKIKMTKG